MATAAVLGVLIGLAGLAALAGQRPQAKPVPVRRPRRR
jgi:hypothetical protein